MVRIVKDPIERRREIMNKAAELFLTVGYEKTSVNTIVEELGVAKGTFYHYFKSKEEVLSAILEESVEKYSECIKEALPAFENAGNKMRFILKKLLIQSEAPNQLFSYVEDNEDARLHRMLEIKFYERFQPILADIIIEGIQEQVFDIKNPIEITEILLIGVRGFMHKHIPGFNDPIYARSKLSAVEELFNKVLSTTNEKFDLKLFD